jgi:hypothetical protein
MKKYEIIYPILIFVFGTLVYFWLVFFTSIVQFEGMVIAYVYLTLVHLSIFFFIWSMISTMATDPGLPPVFWVD